MRAAARGLLLFPLQAGRDALVLQTVARDAHTSFASSAVRKCALEGAFGISGLRSNQTLVAQYTELKVGLAERFRFDREAYTEGKTAFVDRVLAGL